MPAWPAAVFALVFVVALGLLLVSAVAARQGGRGSSSGVPGGSGDGPLRVAVLGDAEHQHP